MCHAALSHDRCHLVVYLGTVLDALDTSFDCGAQASVVVRVNGHIRSTCGGFFHCRSDFRECELGVSQLVMRRYHPSCYAHFDEIRTPSKGLADILSYFFWAVAQQRQCTEAGDIVVRPVGTFAGDGV